MIGLGFLILTMGGSMMTYTALTPGDNLGQSILSGIFMGIGAVLVEMGMRRG